MSAAPDYVEPVVGWRVWSVVAAERRILLRSVFYDALWYPDEPFRAACLRRRAPWWLRRRSGPPRPCPDEECACGVHASRSPRRLLAYLGSGGGDELWRVIGTVALWGEVVECEKGWRAATAYPAHLYVPCVLDDGYGGTRAVPAALAESLAAYHVPVELVSTPDRHPVPVA